MAQDDRSPSTIAPLPAAPGAAAARVPAGDRYEPPRILKKRAVARIAQQFSGGGPSASGPLLVGDG